MLVAARLVLVPSTFKLQLVGYNYSKQDKTMEHFKQTLGHSFDIKGIFKHLISKYCSCLKVHEVIRNSK